MAREVGCIVWPTTTAGEPGSPLAVCQEEGEAKGTLGSDRGCPILASPSSPRSCCPEPGTWASLDRIRKADNKRHLTGVHGEMQGRRGRPPLPTPLPGLLGQGRFQQLQDAAHQVQAARDQYVDGGGLPEHTGPAACHWVGKEALRGTGWLKDGVPALADPLQGVGDAAEDEGAGAVGAGWAGSQQQGRGLTRLRAGGAPRVRAGLLLSQAAPVLLVRKTAEQHLVQGHHEVLLVCEAQGRAHQPQEQGRGAGQARWEHQLEGPRSGPCWEETEMQTVTHPPSRGPAGRRPRQFSFKAGAVVHQTPPPTSPVTFTWKAGSSTRAG